MTDLELSNYCLDIRNIDAKLLADRFASMVVNTHEIKDRMAASLARNRSRLQNQFDELFLQESGDATRTVRLAGAADR
jgi:hypothetical protein